MKIIEALEKYNKSETDIVVFLAGTCTGKNWRKELIDFLQGMNKTLDLTNLVIINPFRKDWPTEDNKLAQQIEWECEMLNQADIFSLYFQKTNEDKSIGAFSLFELGKAIYQMKNLGVSKVNSRLVLSAHKDYSKFNQVKYEIEYSTKLLKLENITLEVMDSINKHGSKIIESYFKLIK